MTTNYNRGRAFEYKVRDHFKELGYPYVMRAAGSHTVADLLVLCDAPHPQDFNPGLSRAYLVQCKRDGKISQAERQKLLDVAHATGAFAVVASQGKRGHPPDFEFISN